MPEQMMGGRPDEAPSAPSGVSALVPCKSPPVASERGPNPGALGKGVLAPALPPRWPAGFFLAPRRLLVPWAAFGDFISGF